MNELPYHIFLPPLYCHCHFKWFIC